MKPLRWFAMSLVAAATLALSHPADAQQPIRRQRNLNPRPTLSPWLNMYNLNGGPLDNYHTFVRPEFRLRSELQRQRQGLLYTQSEINSLEEQQFQGMRQSGVRPTGTGAVFMNYSHYYPSSAYGVRR